MLRFALVLVAMTLPFVAQAGPKAPIGKRGPKAGPKAGPRGQVVAPADRLDKLGFHIGPVSLAGSVKGEIRKRGSKRVLYVPGKVKAKLKKARRGLYQTDIGGLLSVTKGGFVQAKAKGKMPSGRIALKAKKKGNVRTLKGRRVLFLGAKKARPAPSGIYHTDPGGILAVVKDGLILRYTPPKRR